MHCVVRVHVWRIFRGTMHLYSISQVVRSNVKAAGLPQPIGRPNAPPDVLIRAASSAHSDSNSWYKTGIRKGPNTSRIAVPHHLPNKRNNTLQPRQQSHSYARSYILPRKDINCTRTHRIASAVLQTTFEMLECRCPVKRECIR